MRDRINDMDICDALSVYSYNMDHIGYINMLNVVSALQPLAPSVRLSKL